MLCEDEEGKFPINKTRPSGDGDKRLKFNIRAVLTSDE